MARVGDRVRLHYNGDIGIITKIVCASRTFYTVRGEEYPHFIYPSQLESEITLVENKKEDE